MSEDDINHEDWLDDTANYDPHFGVHYHRGRVGRNVGGHPGREVDHPYDTVDRAQKG